MADAFGTIEFGSDQDLYGVWLWGGNYYSFDVFAYDVDPTLAVLDVFGGAWAYDDDSGFGVDSHIDFWAPYSGTFYLDVGSFGEDTGSYLVSSPYTDLVSLG
jgi:serralysin